MSAIELELCLKKRRMLWLRLQKWVQLHWFEMELVTPLQLPLF
jgi:hypothetical protein